MNVHISMDETKCRVYSISNILRLCKNERRTQKKNAQQTKFVRFVQYSVQFWLSRNFPKSFTSFVFQFETHSTLCLIISQASARDVLFATFRTGIIATMAINGIYPCDAMRYNSFAFRNIKKPKQNSLWTCYTVVGRSTRSI